MAGKSAKTSKALKPKKAGGKSAVKKVVKKTKAQIEKQAALKEARTRVRILKSALKEIREQVQAERDEGLPDLATLQAVASSAKTGLDKVQSELGQAKALSKKRKNEIDEWKKWYEKLPAEEKAAGLANLQNEIHWRAAELDANGQKINTLMMSELEAMGAFEIASQKLAAFESGVQDLPVEKDPRLKKVLAELDKATVQVAKLSPKKK